jgi:hypothetical protein
MAQPGIPPREKHLKFGLYNSQGQVIYPQNNSFTISFLFTNESDTSAERKIVSNKDILFLDNKYEITTLRNEEVIITIEDGQDTMTLFTTVSLDSIAFNIGKYKISDEDAELFNNFIFYGKVNIENFKLENFKTNSSFEKLFFSPEIEPKISRKENISTCMKCAQKIEDEHGGTNWAKNTCNTEYQRIYLSSNKVFIAKILRSASDDYRVKIYPVKNKFYLKHEFVPDNNNFHSFSISFNEGFTWIKLLSVKNEWYVSVVYFPDLNKIGIYTENGLILSNCDDLVNWSYYYGIHDANSEKKLKKTYIGLVLRNENWYDNYFTNFLFK